MSKQRVNSHTVSSLTVHLVWSTKYRYSVLKGDIQKSCRRLLIQICDAEDIVILKGVVSQDHMHIEYRPSQDISTIVNKNFLKRTIPEAELSRYFARFILT